MSGGILVVTLGGGHGPLALRGKARDAGECPTKYRATGQPRNKISGPTVKYSDWNPWSRAVEVTKEVPGVYRPCSLWCSTGMGAREGSHLRKNPPLSHAPRAASSGQLPANNPKAQGLRLRLRGMDPPCSTSFPCPGLWGKTMGRRWEEWAKTWQLKAKDSICSIIIT